MTLLKVSFILVYMDSSVFNAALAWALPVALLVVTAGSVELVTWLWKRFTNQRGK